MATKKIQILGTDLLSHLGTVATGQIIPITLSVDAWECEGKGELYRQVIDVDNITPNCRVDISIDLNGLGNWPELRGCGFCVKNDNGDLWVYCNAFYIPDMDIDAQLYVTTVATSYTDAIWGNTFIIL